jgi:phosphatidylglycerophosphatase A|tara:strand:+ start:115 stop:603 length:489 start_codon:yes stop_codon:yes gene_type:complete
MTKSKNLINESIVSFFFLGRAPIAPGTFGSFGSLLLAYLIVQNIEQYTGYLLFSMILIMYYIGLQVAPWCEEKYGKDPSIYVLDEVIGYLIPISILIILNTEITPQIWILSFIAFRVFDVLKIWPAKDLEKIEGGHGILLDDVAAGFQTLILILLCMQLNLI